MRALAAIGKSAEALRYAETSRGLNDHPDTLARACEEILLSSGRADEAYERDALVANRRGSYPDDLSGIRPLAAGSRFMSEILGRELGLTVR